jgi:hypothetical protein
MKIIGLPLEYRTIKIEYEIESGFFFIQKRTAVDIYKNKDIILHCIVDIEKKTFHDDWYVLSVIKFKMSDGSTIEWNFKEPHECNHFYELILSKFEIEVLEDYIPNTHIESEAVVL